MGEFTGSGDSHIKSASDDQNKAKFGSGENEEGYPTDVEGVKADDVIKQGTEEYPVFKVSSQEFFSNQKADRKKIRFNKDSKAGEYMRKTRNGARPFYLKTQSADGTEYVRKIR